MKNIMGKLGILGELLSFFWERKNGWLIPMLVILAIFGLFLVFSSSSSIAPFIYTLF